MEYYEALIQSRYVDNLALVKSRSSSLNFHEDLKCKDVDSIITGSCTSSE